MHAVRTSHFISGYAELDGDSSETKDFLREIWKVNEGGEERVLITGSQHIRGTVLCHAERDFEGSSSHSGGSNVSVLSRIAFRTTVLCLHSVFFSLIRIFLHGYKPVADAWRP